METSFPLQIAFVILQRFEPTYKEWKREVLTKKTIENISFEPTYKEWKLF